MPISITQVPYRQHYFEVFHELLPSMNHLPLPGVKVTQITIHESFVRALKDFVDDVGTTLQVKQTGDNVDGAALASSPISQASLRVELWRKVHLPCKV
jgi:hypothetical protein